MANLWTGAIADEDYVNLATESGQTLTSGDTYLIQSHDNDFYLREGSTGEGVYVKALEKCYVTIGEDDIYVKPAAWGTVKINISSEASAS